MAQRSRPISRRRLHLLSVVAPLIGLATIYLVRLLLLRWWSPGGADLVTGILMTAGVVIVSSVVFRVIDRQDQRLTRQFAELEVRYATEQHLRRQLEALHHAALTIASAHSAPEILQQLVDLARELLGARYGALGVLDASGGIGMFYTARLDQAADTPIDDHGALDSTVADGVSHSPVTVPRDAGMAPAFLDTPAVLTVPVAHAGHLVGNLYLAEPAGAETFDAEAERLLRLLASHAAVVIRQTRLTEQIRVLAVAAERERIRRNLHDGVIQSLYAVNLVLEGAEHDLEQNPNGARACIESAIDRLSTVIEEVRDTILAGFRPESRQDTVEMRQSAHASTP